MKRGYVLKVDAAKYLTPEPLTYEAMKRKGLTPEQKGYKRISRETARMVIRDRKGIWTRYYTDKEGLKDWLLWKLGLKKDTVFDRMKRMGVTGDVLQDMELLTGGKKR